MCYSGIRFRTLSASVTHLLTNGWFWLVPLLEVIFKDSMLGMERGMEWELIQLLNKNSRIS